MFPCYNKGTLKNFQENLLEINFMNIIHYTIYQVCCNKFAVNFVQWLSEQLPKQS